jgi:hypothetical protein
MNPPDVVVVEGVDDAPTVINVGQVGGAPGAPGPPGDPGIVLSPDPPPTTDVLWGDTDEEGTAGGGGGVSDVFAQFTSVFLGVSVAKGTTITISYTNPLHGTATPLPEGWIYSADGTMVGVPPGVYSFTLNFNAPDQYWTGKVQGAYQYGTETDIVTLHSGAPVVGQGGAWFASTSGVAALQNTMGSTHPGLPGYTGPWFLVQMTHAAAAAGTNAAKWQLNVVRLGNIP